MKLKKILWYYVMPVILQIILIPFWPMRTSVPYLAGNTVSLSLCLLTPIYLVIMYWALKQQRFNLVGIHLLMAGVCIIGVIFSYLGWSQFDMYRFLHPDPLTAGFNRSFIRFGVFVVSINMLVSAVIWLIKRYKSGK